MPLQIALLGPVEIRREGAPVRLGRRERAVVALLALHEGRAVPAASVIEHLWGDDFPDTATNAIQGYVSRIRRALGHEAIRTVGVGYALNIDACEVDAYRFEHLGHLGRLHLREGRPEQAASVLRQALGLWRGEPLADCGELFGEAYAIRWHERHLVTLEDRIDADIACGDGPRVLDEVAALASMHPYRERLTAAWMRALYQAGRQTDALEVYAAFRARLADESGLDPTPELQQVQRDILAADSRLTLPRQAARLPIRRPPWPPTELFGRAEELTDVSDRLRQDGGARLVTLLGPGGSGKTRLAIEVAHELVDDFADGVCWVPLQGVGSAQQVLPEVAQSLGLTETDGRALSDVIAAQLARRQVLLVLDNFEHLLPDAALVIADLLRSGPNVRIMCTSRVALRVSGEHRFAVRPLALPDKEVTPEELSSVPACQLFLARAMQVRPDLVVTAQSAALVAHICSQLDGLPLALELAAARCASWSLSSVAARLDDRLTLLTTGTADAPPQQRSLRAALEWSYNLLQEQPRRVLSRLSVARGGLLADSAQIIADWDGSMGVDLIDVLSELVDASLLVATHGPDGAGDRLSMLETVRQFAAERLAEDPEEEAATRHAHTRYCLSVLAHVAERVPPLPANVAEAVSLIAEQDNIRAAMSHARSTNDSELFARLVIAISGSTGMAVMPEEADAWLAEVASGHGRLEDRIPATVMRGFVTLVRGRMTEGVAMLGALLADPLPSAQLAWLTVGRATLSLQASLTGQPQSAVDELSRQSLRDARTLDDPFLLAFVLCTAGAAILSDEDPAAARRLLAEAVDIGSGCNEIAAMSAASNLAELALGTGDAMQASGWARIALSSPIAELIPALRTYPLDLLGAALLVLGEPDEAEFYLREAIALADWCDDKSQVREHLLRFSALASIRGDLDTASTLLSGYAAEGTALGEVVSPSSRTLLRLFLTDLPLARSLLSGEYPVEALQQALPARQLVRLALGGHQDRMAVTSPGAASG